MAKPRKGVIPPHLKPYLFKKKGKGATMAKKKKKHSSKAMTVYRPSAPVVVTKTRHVKVPVYKHSKGGGRALMRREHGAGEIQPGPFRMKSMAVSAMIGKSESKDAGGLAQLQDLIEKLPTFGGIPKLAIAGFILNKFADRGDWYDAAAQAALDISSYKFGQNDFKMSGDDDE